MPKAMTRLRSIAAISALAVLFAGLAFLCGESDGSLLSTTPQEGVKSAGASYSVRVFGFNDLGMHCYDSDFSVFSILPLFNVLHAQVIRTGSSPKFLGNGEIEVKYRARKDSTGSINKTSRGKTNFWQNVSSLYGVALPVDKGLLGAKMPGAQNTPQPFGTYDGDMEWFTAAGIPITGWDDSSPAKRNPYSILSVEASNVITGQLLSSSPVVVPASDEMNCGSCHLTGKQAARRSDISWSNDSNPTRQYKKNVLLLHDTVKGTDLYTKQPVLCASCHYSLALDLKGQGPSGDQVGKPFFSRAIHGFHASEVVQDYKTSKTCFSCHPGKETQCLRGIMSQKGIVCTDCHGNMFALAKVSRQPWADEPKCQSCHTGDAVDHKGTALVFRKAYDDGPKNATPRIASNKRFAEENGTLYRNGLGHNAVACEACHGSPHAEWPSREANDNLIAVQFQGHKGTIVECGTCHGSGLGAVVEGPHGLHNVNARVWYDGGHSGFYRSNKTRCQACHGKDLSGTRLSRTAESRRFNVEERVVPLAAGKEVGCTLCHEKPGSGDM